MHKKFRWNQFTENFASHCQKLFVSISRCCIVHELQAKAKFAKIIKRNIKIKLKFSLTRTPKGMRKVLPKCCPRWWWWCDVSFALGNKFFADSCQKFVKKINCWWIFRGILFFALNVSICFHSTSSFASFASTAAVSVAYLKFS